MPSCYFESKPFSDFSRGLFQLLVEDASFAIVGRRSGRFSSGPDAASFRIRVPTVVDIWPHIGLPTGISYSFSAWVRGDRAGQKISILSTVAAVFGTSETTTDETELTSVVAGTDWKRLAFSSFVPNSNHTYLAISLSRPGVLWIDDVRLQHATDLLV